jgi:hypothetical protein
MSKSKMFDRRSIWAVFVVGVVLLAANLIMQLNTAAPALATAPGIAPTLEKKADGVYYLMWTNDDTVYVNCYPGVTPKLAPAPAKHNSARFSLTCGRNPVKPYRA